MLCLEMNSNVMQRFIVQAFQDPPLCSSTSPRILYLYQCIDNSAPSKRKLVNRWFPSDDWLDADVIGCYKFLETEVNVSWVEAHQKCEEIDGYLAEPRTRRYLCT